MATVDAVSETEFENGPGGRVGYPTFDDAPFINRPILIVDGGSENYPIQNKWIRVELIMEQSSTVARKACRDKRPMGPPTFILMNLYEVHHPLSYAPDGQPIHPPSNCPESQIPATDDLSTFFICIPSLFRVYPPTREEELGRVLRTKTVTGHERIRAQKGDLPTRSASFSATAEPVSDDGHSDGSPMEDGDPDGSPHLISQDHEYDHDHASNPLPRPAVAYPYPATAISCSHSTWPSAVETARDLARQQWPSLPQQPCPITHGPLEVGVDLSKEEMTWVQQYLPREDLRFVRTEHGFEDMRSRLQEVSTRKGCLLLNTFSTGCKGFVFVFDNILLLEEGYWAIRFAVCNIGWSAHSTFCSGERSYGTLADVYTGAIGVYSSKQWPTLPPTSKVTEHYATQIKLCHREQGGGKKTLKISSPPTNHAVNPVIKDTEKAATTKKPHRRQMTSPHAPADAEFSSSQTRRKVTEIRKDAREAKVHNTTSTPFPRLGESEPSGRGQHGEIEVARTEPCSPVLSARVMAAVRHGEPTWVWEGWGPSHEDCCPQVQGRPYSDIACGSSSIPLEPPYPLISSIWPNPRSQRQCEVIPTRLRAIEGLLSHPARPQSPVPRPPRPRPQSLQMPYSLSPRSVTHSAPSTMSPPPSAISTCFTPPRPSMPARSTSWAQYSTVPFTEQVAPVYASSPGPSIQLLQAPGQQGYFMHYPDANQYRHQTFTAYTEEPVPHQPIFESGRLHIGQHPRGQQSVNLYPSPTSSVSFASVTPPTNATQHSYSSPATHEPGQ